jgi:hypothetical protein
MIALPAVSVGLRTVRAGNAEYNNSIPDSCNLSGVPPGGRIHAGASNVRRAKVG